MEIKIRQKPQRSTGKTSLVLEYYYGYTRDDEGRIKHRRKFETLEYYLYTDPKNKLERDHNKVNLEMAEKVKAKRLLAEQNEQYGFAVKYKIRTNLVEYIKGLIEQRKESPGNWGNWDSALKHLVAYAGTNTTFEMVDKKFVEGFKTYLAKQAKTKSNTALSTNSQSSYFLKLKAALNQAVEDGIIPHSPAMSVKPAHVEDVHREYLTFDELQRLAKTECPYPVLKDAFLFSCLTGMRWSDINKLTWAEVQEFDGGTRIVFRQKKTKGLEYLDLTGKVYDYKSAYVTNAKGKDEDFSIMGNIFNIANINAGDFDIILGSTLFCVELNANSIKHKYILNGQDKVFDAPITVDGNKVTLDMSAVNPALRKVEMYMYQDADDSQLHMYMHTDAFINYFANLEVVTLIAEGKINQTDEAAIAKVFADMEARVESINVSFVMTKAAK